MSDPRPPEAVLITGVYGAGKSSMAAELATFYDETDLAYGTIDLDWLGWFNAHHIAEHSDDATRVMERNLAAVLGNYRDEGIARFILAGAYLGGDQGREVDELRSAIDMPVRVVALEISAEEVRRRLGDNPESGRADDLAQAEEWLVSGAADFAFADLVVNGEQPLRDIAEQIATWLGWKKNAS